MTAVAREAWHPDVATSDIPMVVCLGLTADQLTDILEVMRRGSVVIAPATDLARHTLLAAAGTLSNSPRPVASVAPRRAPDIRLRDLVIDPTRREATLRGVELALTARSFDLLAALATPPIRVWTFEELTVEVWRQPYLGDRAPIASAVKRLRQTLSGRSPEVAIDTVRGVGFRLRVEASDADVSSRSGAASGRPPSASA